MLGSDRDESDAVSVLRRDSMGPRREFGTGPFEPVVGVPEGAGRQSSYSALYSALGVVTITELGAAEPNTACSSAPRRGGSTCSTTSISTAAS